MNITLPTSLVLNTLQGYRFNALYGRGATKAVIAGGCLRDILLGKPVSDIDVFHEGALEDVEDLTLMEKPAMEEEYEESIQIYSDTSMIWPLQYIQVEDIERRLSTFSTPLSQVYLDDTGVVLTRPFVLAVESKQFGFETWASEAYKAKLKAKYPEFK
jgi:poly(A) polymerase-like protein